MEQVKKILVTGGTGFIGSHIVAKLITSNRYDVIIYDNLSNSKLDVLNKIQRVVDYNRANKTNEIKEQDSSDSLENHSQEMPNKLTFIKGDIRDEQHLDKLFSEHRFDSVIHLAALKSVSESQRYPQLYEDVNVKGTKILLQTMKKYAVTNFIYSSSATVYGDSVAPVTEDSITGNNLACVYAENKYNIERYLIDNYDEMFVGWNIAILRYFNPIGAHESGLIGEDPNDVPNNVFPYLLRVAKFSNNVNNVNNSDNVYKEFTIFGGNYDTEDGTCLRDYVHVQDLARAHVEILNNLSELKKYSKTYNVYNIGTGLGTSVLQLVKIFNDALIERGKLAIPYRVGDRRDGDLAVSFSNADKIFREIGFKTEYDVNKMCQDGLTFAEL